MAGVLLTIIASGFSLAARLRWFGIPVSLGVACLALLQLRRTLKRGTANPASPQPLTWQLVAFCQLPSRALSRSWGTLMDRELPSWLRRPLLGLYVWMYSCNMAEAEEANLQKYASFSELFVRRLKKNARVIDSTHVLVAPVDGRVLHCGLVEGNCVEQVKGVHYSLDAFLGPGELTSMGHTAATMAARSFTAGEQAPDEERKNGKEEEEEVEKQLYHVVMYLAPGDYHHFHSPTEWRAQLCRHITGELLTVAPWAAHKMPGLFALNERILLAGVWPHGLFTFTAVGAYNVGSIGLSLEEVKDLQTNKKGRYQFGSFSDTPLSAGGVALSRGDRVGVFRLGSSVVLLFEAPKEFRFVVKPGQKVFYGQPLGHTAMSHQLAGPSS